MAEQSGAHAHFSIVITSCGRYDLLRQTLTSLFQFIDQTPVKTILIEDSVTSGVDDAVKGLAAPIELIVNERQLGQIASIDRAYAEVETPFVFHCEDDWEFFRTGFIAESHAVLDAHPQVSMVGLRARDQLNPRIHDVPALTTNDVDYFLHDPTRHPEYFSYSFNPGLRRMEDVRRIGPFSPIGGEADISYAFKKAGFQCGNLENPAVRHIGDGRHVHDPEQPKRTTGGFARLKRSIDKRVKRLRRTINR